MSSIGQHEVALQVQSLTEIEVTNVRVGQLVTGESCLVRFNKSDLLPVVNSLCDGKRRSYFNDDAEKLLASRSRRCITSNIWISLLKRLNHRYTTNSYYFASGSVMHTHILEPMQGRLSN
jgi:hypothetical protein